jgi:hypothetical protein
MSLQTEFEFTLPLGYVDADGNLHRKGTMRLATAMDEIMPLRDPRVQSNQAYLVIILLSRVITKLGTLSTVNTGIIEKLFAADLAYLQEFYHTVNEQGKTTITVTCQKCATEFEVDLADLGGVSKATP